MELPSKNLEQKAFNTRRKTEEQKLIVMDNFLFEERLCQHLKTNIQFKIAVNF